MKTIAAIITLSDCKIKSAEALCKDGCCDDAYYMGGYALELLLKAKITKLLDIEDFFDFSQSKNRRLPLSRRETGETEYLYKPYKVHSYEQLAILAGLYKTISDKIGSEADFKSDWSVITNWCESLRYETGKNKSDTESFIKSIKEVAVWLKSII